MRNRFSNMMFVASLILAALPIWAHHGKAGYDTAKVVRMEGVVTELEWVNPHVWIHLAVKNDGGAATEWRIESGSPNIMKRRGLTQKALAVGTELTVIGYVERSGKNIFGTTALKVKGGEEVPMPLPEFYSSGKSIVFTKGK